MVSRGAKIATAIIVLGGLATVGVVYAKRRQAGGGFTGTFTLHVENNNTLAPIAGAAVTYAGVQVTTDASGNALFTNVPPTGALSITATGFLSYPPTTFSPTGPGPYFVGLGPASGGVPYDQSFAFQTSTESAPSASAIFMNQNTISIDAVCYCNVKAGLQTVAVGQSAPITVAPGGTATFPIPFVPSLPPGTYVFNFFIWDTQGRPASSVSSVTATV